MTESSEILLLRKQLLQARAVLARARLRRDLAGLQDATRLPQLAGAALRSNPLRLLFLGLVLMAVPSGRLSGGVRLAARALQLGGVAARCVVLWKQLTRRPMNVRQRTDRIVLDA